MSAVDWVKLELRLGNGRCDEPLRLPERMSITTLAVLRDTSANRHRIYLLNKACSADIPGWREFSPMRSTPSSASQALAFGLTGRCCCSTRTPWWALRLEFRPGAWLGLRRDDWNSPSLPAAAALATALKRYAMEQARTWGATTIRTVNHPMNRPIINADRKLGFHEADFDLG